MIFFILLLLVGTAKAADIKFIDGKPEFVVGVGSRALPSPSKDEVFISTSIPSFKGKSDFDSYFTKEKIFERIAFLLNQRQARTVLNESTSEIDSQIDYLKKMYQKL